MHLHKSIYVSRSFRGWRKLGQEHTLKKEGENIIFIQLGKRYVLNHSKSFQTSYKSKSLTRFLRKQEKQIRIGIEGLIEYRGRTPAVNLRLNWKNLGPQKLEPGLNLLKTPKQQT